MADLITLQEYRDATGKSATDTREDSRFSSMVPYASAAIRSYTERDFGAPIVTETREFAYDGSGFLDIDDASDVQSLYFTYPGTGIADQEIPSLEWSPRPQRRDDAPIYYYVAVGRGWGYGGSPEMGFERNLDVWVRERRFEGVATSLIKVTATWGWPNVPGDVKLATIWTLQSWLSKPTGQGLTSEAIEGWSRSWGTRGNALASSLAIPDEARDLLSGYTKGM